MGEGVCTFVPIGCGVREGSHPDAVQDDQDGTLDARFRAHGYIIVAYSNVVCKVDL
jgi:hypothetical protein